MCLRDPLLHGIHKEFLGNTVANKIDLDELISYACRTYIRIRLHVGSVYW